MDVEYFVKWYMYLMNCSWKSQSWKKTDPLFRKLTFLFSASFSFLFLFKSQTHDVSAQERAVYVPVNNKSAHTHSHINSNSEPESENAPFSLLSSSKPLFENSQHEGVQDTLPTQKVSSGFRREKVEEENASREKLPAQRRHKRIMDMNFMEAGVWGERRQTQDLFHHLRIKLLFKWTNWEESPEPLGKLLHCISPTVHCAPALTASVLYTHSHL